MCLRRCGNNATYQVSPPDVTPGPEEEEEKGDEEETAWKYLALPPSTGDDVTVECVAYNRFDVSRDVFILCECENTNECRTFCCISCLDRIDFVRCR